MHVATESPIYSTGWRKCLLSMLCCDQQVVTIGMEPAQRS